VRLPTEPIEAATFEQLRNFGLSVLFIAGLTAVLFIFASMLLVIRPLRAINKALRQAVENPDRADAYQLHMMRRDEIGQISRLAEHAPDLGFRGLSGRTLIAEEGHRRLRFRHLAVRSRGPFDRRQCDGDESFSSRMISTDCGG
jgi:hypothetical protein